VEMEEEVETEGPVLGTEVQTERPALSNGGYERRDEPRAGLGPFHPLVSGLWARMHSAVQMVAE